MAQSTIDNAPLNPAEEHRGDLGYFEHRLAKKGTKIQVYVKVVEVETGIKLDKSKTLGTVTTKNSTKILMSAHSGYSTGLKREYNCLDTKKWNKLAYHIAKQICFKFPKNIRDNAGHPILDEHRGRAHAGHVEVLLASWFVLYVLRGEPELANKSEERLIPQLKRLRNKNLGEMRTCFITIDSEPCRTCLQFINQLSQYTGIMFMILGSQGVGPIQVRIDGERRQDIVGDYFPDSEDDISIREETTRPEEAAEKVSPQDVEMPDLIPATPVTSGLRRPQSSWGRKALQWTPDHPEELLSSYKKKTPVYMFPGYDGEPCRNSVTPSPGPRPPAIRPVLTSSAKEGEQVMSVATGHNIQDDWEELGDGLMICCQKTTSTNQEGNAVKCEQVTYPNPVSEPQGYLETSTAHVSGNSYARAAYEVIVGEMEYDLVERPRKAEGYLQNLPRHRPNRQPASSTEILRTLAPIGMPQLQQFRHRPIDDRDESIFKTRYSILNPKYKR
ncbi:hypothetical protein F4859DRAFT_513981 [Xylaria cf. heliscus]|nr:hypothetical protein F4859DRAFT_513981 [Xylaria cf. heliscus]